VNLAAAASCLEFFADAHRLFVGLGNGTIKVTDDCDIFVINFENVCMHSHLL